MTVNDLQNGIVERDEHYVMSLEPNTYKSSQGLFPLLYQSNALAGEAGEFCNIIKKMVRDTMVTDAEFERLTNEAKEQGYESLKDKRTKQAGKELGDVLMFAALAAEALGLSLDDETKNKFNEVSEKLKLNIKL